MTTNDQAKPRVPSVEEIMRCHRLMMKQVCNQETMPEADINEMNILEQFIGPFDTHEILHDKITALQAENAKLKEAYGVLREGLWALMQNIERDRIFEDIRCPGFDGSMKIETRYDEALAKAEGVLK